MTEDKIIIRQPIFRMNIPITDAMLDSIELLESEEGLNTSTLNDIVKIYGSNSLDRLDKDHAIIEHFSNENGDIDQYQICLWGNRKNPTPENMMAVFCKISQTTEDIPVKSGFFRKSSTMNVPVITTLPVLAICGKNLSSLLIYQMDCCGTNSAVISLNIGDDFISFNRDPVSGISNEHHLVFENRVRRATAEDEAMFEKYIANGFKSSVSHEREGRPLSPKI